MNRAGGTRGSGRPALGRGRSREGDVAREQPLENEEAEPAAVGLLAGSVPVARLEGPHPRHELPARSGDIRNRHAQPELGLDFQNSCRSFARLVLRGTDRSPPFCKNPTCRGLESNVGFQHRAFRRDDGSLRVARMCLAIPGRIVDVIDEANRLAMVDVAGVQRTINIGLLDEDGEGVGPGDWVLIHVGFAMSRVDEEEALATRRQLERMGQDYEAELEELKASVIE